MRHAMAILRFQCSECGFGDREVGHLMDEGEIYCVATSGRCG
jgi:predicted nucleic acid-binding Zn ribbon protein